MQTGFMQCGCRRTARCQRGPALHCAHCLPFRRYFPPINSSARPSCASLTLHSIHLRPTHTQVEGAGGFGKLVQKVRVGGPFVLWHGALAASAATFVGHYPWCVPWRAYGSVECAAEGYCVGWLVACQPLPARCPPDRTRSQPTFCRIAPRRHDRFFVYNELNAALPQYDELPKRLLRSALIGFCASAVSGALAAALGWDAAWLFYSCLMLHLAEL